MRGVVLDPEVGRIGPLVVVHGIEHQRPDGRRGAINMAADALQL